MSQPQQANSEIEYLRIPRVEKMTGFSRSTIWRKARNGEFPRPIKISDRVTVWNKKDVIEWMKEKEAAAQ